MNKFIALAFLTFLVLVVVPELGIIEQGHIINTTASTKTVTVYFILNESKTIYIAWGSMVEYDYIEADYSGYAILPANTTIEIASNYPFEVNGTLAWIYIGPKYAYFINFTHNTVVYISFLPKQPPNMKIYPAFAPPPQFPNTTHKNITDTTTITTTQTITPVEGITIAIGSLVLVVTVVIIASALVSRRGKK